MWIITALICSFSINPTCLYPHGHEDSPTVRHGISRVLSGDAERNDDEHYHSPPLVLPLQNERTWKPANLSSLKCPEASHLGPDEHRVMEKWLVHRPKSSVLTKVEGSLCHKSRWLTRCEYTWYFSKTVSRKIEPMPPTKQECEEAIKRKEEGLLESLGFPPPACYWARTNDEENVQVDVTDHPMTYDPYSDGVVDNILVGGKCNQRECETVHDSTIWLETQKEKRPSQCEMDVEEQLELVSGIKRVGGSKSKAQRSVFVVGTNYPFMDATGACRLKYCSKSGMLLSNGLWFHITRKISPESNENSKFWLTLSDCSSDKQVGVLGEEYEIGKLQATMEDIMWDLDCFRTLEDLSHHKKVSMLDLFRLSRLTPGTGPAYKLVKGNLMVKEVQYVKAQRDQGELANPLCVAFMTESKNADRCIRYDEYDKEGPYKGQVMNGILINEGMVVFPHERFHLRQWDPEFIIKHEIKQVHHPVLGNYSSQIHDSLHESLIKDHSANLGDVMGNWVQVATSKFSWFFKEIEKFIIGGALLLIFILIALMVCRGGCCKVRRKAGGEKGGDSSGDEMNVSESIF
ncbi:glycoprotein [Le Dantec virus]|uniref:Glycoprotein n=1 Tax=Le Dantec virus TaxID=318848 RepID=A0A0D3R1C5_9RHAB|nr:glycoprotein [Le Dantec virus]AJR28453.1 glycoprotein [Le Dantec virus]